MEPERTGEYFLDLLTEGEQVQLKLLFSVKVNSEF